MPQGLRGREWQVDISAAVIALEGSPVEEGDNAITGERTGPATLKVRHINAFE